MNILRLQRIVLVTIVLGGGLFSSRSEAAAPGFSFRDEPGVALAILHDGRPVAAYMYAHDTSSEERHHETYKPYLHVYDAEGRSLITKGAGGDFTHHRGIFIGWNRIEFGGQRFDRWHMKGGDIVHREFKHRSAGRDEAVVTSVTEWNDGDGVPFLVEHRTMTFRPGGEVGRLWVDFSTTLKAVRGDVLLKGDPEHAGVQFRPANEVDRRQTVYVFPGREVDPRKDEDLPWVGETYTLHDRQHSVVHMNHPDNPRGTRYSAYRDYGRFGAFFERPITGGESLTVQYRFVIADGEMPSVELIQSAWDEFAGVATPSPVPEITIQSGT